MADANALGWVSVPFVPVFDGITKRIEQGMVKPMTAGSKKAAVAVQKTADDMVKSLERQAAASKKKVDSLGKSAEEAAGKEKAARQKVEAAIARQKAAEEDYQKALAKGESGSKELAKLEDAKAKVTEATIKAKKAEQDATDAQKKAKDQADDYAKTVGKLEDAQKSAKDEEDRHKGALGGLRKEMDKAKAAADEAGTSFHDIGAKLKTGMAAAAGAVAGGLAGLVKVGTTFDNTWDTVRAGTGATGEAFEALKENIRNVAKESVGVGGDFEAIGSTAADLNTRLGLTGKPLEDMTRSMMQLQGLGVDADINSLSQAMNGFGVEAEDMPAMLDKMFQVSQATGLSVSELANSAVKAGPSLRGFGFDMADSAALVGQMDKAGLDADKTLQSMQRALAEFASEGRDAPEALKETIGSIEELINAGDEAGAIDMASNIFGTRGAAQFVDAVKTGTLSVDDFMAATGATSDTINGVAEETASFAEKWDQFKLNALAALEPVASKIFDSIAPAMQLVIDKVMPLAASFAEQLGPVLESVVGKLTSVGEWILKNKDYLVPLLAAVGTAIGLWKAWALGMTAVTTALKLAKAAQEGMNLAMKANVIGIVVTAIAALTAGLVWFFTKTETGRELWDKFTSALADGWGWVVEKLSSGWTWLMENVFQPMGSFFMETLWPAIQSVMGFVGDAFSAVWDGLSWAWESIIQPVFNGIWELAQATLAVIGTVILTPLLIAWNLLSSAVQWAWENVIQPVWQALADFAMNTLWPALQSVFQWIGDAWQWLSDKFSEVWGWIRDNVLNPMVDFFQNTLWPAIQSVIDWIVDKWNWLSETLSTVWGWIYDNVIQRFIDGFHAIWDAVSAVASWISDKWNWMYGNLLNVWNWLNENVIQRQIRGFHRIWEAVLSVAGWIADKWQWMADRLHAGWEWINDHVFTPFKDGLTQLKSFFGTVVDGIRSVWDGLRSVLAKPINFMINTVYNDGIAKAWDTIAGFLPLEPKTAKRLSPIGGYATGGAIRGEGTGTSDDILAWLSNGEHVWTAQDVRDIGGQSAMYAMRDALKHGRGFTFDGKDLALLPHVNSRVSDLAGAAPGLFPQGAFKDGGEVRPMWELQLERGHRWAKSRHGRPYVLGGSADGGGGTDCSGFMSGIADVMGGGSGARQWATMAFNGGGNSQYPSGPQGFVAGLKAHTFSIGVTNGGAAGGHTAGTLGATSRVGAVNVESGGSPSLVKYGTGAVGANDGYFTTHYHLPIGPGGAFEIGKGSGGPSPDMMRSYISKKVEGAIDKIMGPIANRLPSGPPVWKDIPRGVYDKGKESMADKTADVVANLGDRLSTVFTAAQEVGDIVRDGARGVMELAGRAIGLHDQGGWLQDGNLALNMSGKPEPVLTNAQWASVSEMVKSIGDLVPAIEGQTDVIARAVDDAQAWLSKAGDYNSIEGINARQGVRRMLDLGLDLPGSDIVKMVLDGEDTLWESRARAAKNLDTIVEKEKALEDARKAVADLNDMPEGVSEDDQKKIDEAQKALDDAKAEKAKAESDDDRAKAADKVTEAEKKLKDVREEVDKNSEENAKKHAEEVTKANEAVSKAGQELADARKKQAMDLDNVVLMSQGQIKGMIPQAKQLADQLIGMGAPAQAVNAGLGQVTSQLARLASFAGPAGITLGMAMDMLKVGIGIIKAIVGAIEDLIAKIRKARLDALKALADGWSIIADYAKLITDLQGKVTSLQQALIRGANAQREAEYNLMLAQHDRYIAEAEGALKVAEARLALDAEIKRGATIAQLKMMGLHEDWDSYMAYQALEAQGVLQEWSDSAISALFTYEKARAEALKGEVSARLEQIKAESALAEAQRENVRNQQDLLKAQERLIRMSAKVAGVDLVEATGTAQVAKLMAEMAEVKQAMDKNVFGRWGAKLGANGSHANEYRGQQAQYNSLQQALDAVLAETGVNIDRGNLDRVLKLMGRAAYRGGDPMAVLRAQLPELAQAETALKINESLKPVYDARDQRDDLARQVEDFTAEIDLYEKTTPLEHTLKGLDYLIKSLEQSSQAWADGNEELRGEYLAAAKENRDAAESAGVNWKLDSKYANAGVRDQIRRETTIHLDGEKMYTADQIDQLLAEVTSGTNGSYRIVRSASEVAVSRRKERV